MSSTYIVKVGESITDVILNSTGSLVNWDAILTANGFTDWIPTLTAGDSIVIPDNVNIDNNSLQDAQQYPKCNAVRQEIYDLIKDVFNVINNVWILRSGSWDDTGIWVDGAVW